MLARMRAFVAAPCDELSALIKGTAALEQAEPDPTRRTSRVRRAIELRDFTRSILSQLDHASVCRTLKAFVPTLDQTIAAIEGSAASDWEVAMVAYRQLEAELRSMIEREPRALAPVLVTRILGYQAADTKTQCARYEGTSGTEVGMTMFYTDLLAKLWMSTDYGLRHQRSASLASWRGHGSTFRPSSRHRSRRIAARGSGLAPRAGGVSRMAELKQRSMGPLPDRMTETSTGTRFDCVPPSKPAPDGRILPPMVIHHHLHRAPCDADRRTPTTADDCRDAS